MPTSGCEFGKGISSDDEPDLWRKDLTGDILQWIELGQPDEQRIRKACGRARQVVVINYGGRARRHLVGQECRLAAAREEPHRDRYSRRRGGALAALAERGMRLQCMIQDRPVQMFSDEHRGVTIDPAMRMAPAQCCARSRG